MRTLMGGISIDDYSTLAIIVLIIASIWVYRDAKGKKVRNPAGWAVATFFVLIIALPLYLVWGKKRIETPAQQQYAPPPPAQYGPPQQQYVSTSSPQYTPPPAVQPQAPARAGYCAKCGSAIPAEDHFCPNCGAAAPADRSTCPRCGNANPPGSKFCPNCSYQLQ